MWSKSLTGSGEGAPGAEGTPHNGKLPASGRKGSDSRDVKGNGGEPPRTRPVATGAGHPRPSNYNKSNLPLGSGSLSAGYEIEAALPSHETAIPPARPWNISGSSSGSRNNLAATGQKHVASGGASAGGSRGSVGRVSIGTKGVYCAVEAASLKYDGDDVNSASGAGNCMLSSTVAKQSQQLFKAVKKMGSSELVTSGVAASKYYGNDNGGVGDAGLEKSQEKDTINIAAAAASGAELRMGDAGTENESSNGNSSGDTSCTYYASAALVASRSVQGGGFDAFASPSGQQAEQMGPSAVGSNSTEARKSRIIAPRKEDLAEYASDGDEKVLEGFQHTRVRQGGSGRAGVGEAATESLPVVRKKNIVPTRFGGRNRTP